MSICSPFSLFLQFLPSCQVLLSSFHLSILLQIVLDDSIDQLRHGDLLRAGTPKNVKIPEPHDRVLKKELTIKIGKSKKHASTIASRRNRCIAM